MLILGFLCLGNKGHYTPLLKRNSDEIEIAYIKVRV